MDAGSQFLYIYPLPFSLHPDYNLGALPVRKLFHMATDSNKALADVSHTFNLEGRQLVRRFKIDELYTMSHPLVHSITWNIMRLERHNSEFFRFFSLCKLQQYYSLYMTVEVQEHVVELSDRVTDYYTINV